MGSSTCSTNVGDMYKSPYEQKKEKSLKLKSTRSSTGTQYGDMTTTTHDNGLFYVSAGGTGSSYSLGGEVLSTNTSAPTASSYTLSAATSMK